MDFAKLTMHLGLKLLLQDISNTIKKGIYRNSI